MKKNDSFTNDFCFFFKAFYIIYDFGQFSKTLYFDGLFNSIIDTFNLSFKEIDGNYVALKNSPYKLIGTVNIFFFYELLFSINHDNFLAFEFEK